MKVLWVCNIMLPAVAKHLGRDGSNKEGWLSGLCRTILDKQKENGIELHVAFPVDRELEGYEEEISLGQGKFVAHGFYEDVNHAETYDETLEIELRKLIDRIRPDVIHCFGTEFGHALAVVKCAPDPERVVIGIQGVCGVIAEAYMANLPEDVQNSKTFRDWLKRDSLRQQQDKFRLRGIREKELLHRAVNVIGRTEFDRQYAQAQNPKVRYFSLNETLRPCFYDGKWSREECAPHSVFISQGDYPLKGLHYMLLAAVKLKEKYPDVKISVAGNSLVNDTTVKDKIKISAYGKYLRELIRKNKLQDCVSFLGRLSAEEMKAQYLKSGLYVCCSANENSPNSLGEAMMLGVPCVVAAVGGIPDLFEDGKDGICYKGWNVQEQDKNNTCNQKTMTENLPIHAVANRLFWAIDKMWSEPEKIEYYCENARLHAKKTHNQEENDRKMMEIYATIKE